MFFMPKLIIRLLLFLIFSTSNNGIAQTHVVGALETYRFWAGEDPDSTRKVLNGEYWSYSHNSKEYKLYMEIKVKPTIAKYFISDNNLKRGKYQILSGVPKWFKPPKNYEVWTGTQESRYYINKKTGHIFMYEVQL